MTEHTESDQRLYSWVRLSDTVWEHEPSGTKLVVVGDEWVVRFPSTTAVPFSCEDAEAMWRIMVNAIDGRPPLYIGCRVPDRERWLTVPSG